MKTEYITNKNKGGFTLLEVLLVVSALGILAGIIILAINPGKQLADTRNAQRKIDVNTIINALYQFSLDNNGAFPASIDSSDITSQVLGTNITGCDTTCGAAATVAACVDLTANLTPTFLVDIPTDPGPGGTSANTDYYVNKLASGRITVGACDPEQGAIISVTR